VSSKSRKQQLEEMLADEPQDPFLLYGLAMEFVSEGDFETAVKHFRGLISADPTYVPAYLQQGQALQRLGRATDAVECYRRGIDVARARGDAHAAEEMSGFLANLQ
jgi:Tfp pilus assembly protein PilF